MKISGLAIKRAYDEWWGRFTREGDPIQGLVTEAFIAGWNAGVARAASVADAHPHLPDADEGGAQGCCEVIAGSIGDLIERVKP